MGGKQLGFSDYELTTAKKQTKGNQWYFGMKVHAGVDKDSGLIHSVVVTAANLHDLNPAAELRHGDEEVVYGDAGYQGVAKRPEMAGTAAEFRMAMRPGNAAACLIRQMEGSRI